MVYEIVVLSRNSSKKGEEEETTTDASRNRTQGLGVLSILCRPLHPFLSCLSFPFFSFLPSFFFSGETKQVLQVALLLFFLVAGGPFGLEAAIGTLGPLITMIGVVVFSILMGGPQLLMALELNGMINSEDGGGYVWAKEAFGVFGGWLNGWNNVASSLISLGMLVQLLSFYTASLFGGTFWTRFGLSVAFLVVADILCIFGARIVAHLNAMVLLLIFAPFVALLIWILVTPAASTIISNASSVLFVPSMSEVSGPAIATWISIVMWTSDGWDSLGQYSSDVPDKRTFAASLVFVIPAIVLNVCIPIVIAYPLAPVFTDWGMDSQKTEFTKALSGAATWLGVFCTVGAIASILSCLCVSLLSLARVTKVASQGRDQIFPSFLARSWGSVPLAGILILSALSMFLTLLPFDYIAQIYLVARVLNLEILYASLLALRKLKPDALRPFTVSSPLVYVLGIPTLAAALVVLVFAEWSVYVASAVFEVVVVISYFVFWMWRARVGRVVQPGEFSEDVMTPLVEENRNEQTL